ncbi:MAG TPA: S24 family peptidase [Verrucomicrobiae bacterium]|nr:S24 family peptidase [Verrucomicrobiae bacterium]
MPGLGPRAYCLSVDGDGLRPRFAKGDVVIVDPDRMPQPGDMVVLYGNAKIAAIAEHDGHPKPVPCNRRKGVPFAVIGEHDASAVRWRFSRRGGMQPVGGGARKGAANDFR